MDQLYSVWVCCVGGCNYWISRRIGDVGWVIRIVQAGSKAYAGEVSIRPVEGAAGRRAETDRVPAFVIEFEFANDKRALLSILKVVVAIVTILVAIALAVRQRCEIEPACGEGTLLCRLGSNGCVGSHI